MSELPVYKNALSVCDDTSLSLLDNEVVSYMKLRIVRLQLTLQHMWSNVDELVNEGAHVIQSYALVVQNTVKNIKEYMLQLFRNVL